MATYTTQAVIQPDIPRHLIDDKTKALLESAGLTLEVYGENYYLFAEDGLDSCYDEEKDEAIEYEEVLQGIIKGAGEELDHLTVSGALTCSRMRPDGFGGFAMFITAKTVDYWSTNVWLMEKVREHCQD